MDDVQFEAQLRELEDACIKESDTIREIVSEMVPTYRYKKEKANG